MARINLLPWREQLREERQRQFLIILAGIFFGACAILFLVDEFLTGAIEQQTARNTVLRNGISVLDKSIAEISTLRTRRQELLARMKTIQDLQGNRPVIAHVFDQLVRTLPDGVYFTSLRMTKQTIAISGAAESNNRVSTLMRNLDGSDWLTAPNLAEVKAAANGGNVFQLTVLQTQPAAVLAQQSAAQGISQSGKPR